MPVIIRNFFGYVVSEHGRTPDPSKIEAVASFPRLTCKSDVQKFLGPAGYYCEHIPHFAASSFNLRKLLKNNSSFHWGDQEQKEFDSLKQALCSNKVLLQQQRTPMRYASRALQATESKWTTHEQELLAVIWAWETFHVIV